jgi:membrane-bound lytic murein transglycosylase F
MDFDWRLMASIAYQESRFDTTLTSWAGAGGLMQVMPKTFTGMGENIENINNPEASVRAASKYIRSLIRSFSNIENKEERIKFVLAGYNSGIGHILDAQALAKKYGKNPNIWADNVDEYVLLKSNPEYYTDSVCRFGYFRGKETYAYVREVLLRYEYYKSKVTL